ncbi:hypothetical protein D3C77_548070 [compost metagenome]
MQACTDQFRQLPADRQTNAQATVLAAHRAIDLEEALIQPRLGQPVETDPAVVDADGQAEHVRRLQAPANLQGDATLVGELDPVVEQVADAQGQFMPVADQQLGQIRGRVQIQVQPLAQCGSGVLGAQFLQQTA